MADEVQVKFNSFSLDDGNTYLVDDIKADANNVINVHKIPGAQGSIVDEGERESLSFKLSGSITASDYDALRTAFDNLKAILYDGIKKFTLDDDRYIMAQLENFSYNYKKLRTLITWDATFVAHYPFWLNETETVSDETPTSGVGYVITNNGNARARCKIEVTAPAGGISDACKIENQTNGESLQYRGDVAAGKVLEIDGQYDTDDQEVLNDGVEAIVDYEGDFIELEPGENTIIFTGPAGTAVKFTFKDTYA